VNYIIRHGRRIEVVTIDRGITPKPARKPFRARWVKVPTWWIHTLKQSRSVSTYELALTILHEAFKRQHVGGEIVLSSAVTGMPSNTKMRAARELADLGLIELDQADKRAVRVSIKEEKKVSK
jgi:hypothetical protein